MSNVSLTSASDIQMDYMKLLTTQLQNQNPLEPMSNEEMTSQLTQFSQLGQLEDMNSSFSEVLATVQRDHATSLIGKEVTFVGETDTGEVGMISGRVEQVVRGEDGRPVLDVNGYALSLEDVISVKE